MPIDPEGGGPPIGGGGGGGVFGGGGGGGGVIPTGSTRAGFLGRRSPNYTPFDPRRRRADMLSPTNAYAGGGVGEQYSATGTLPSPMSSGVNMSSPGSTGIVPGVPMGPASQQYGGAADRVNQAAGGFSFTPNQNDPELNALHSRMQQSQMARFLRNRDEFARAGLLGSSQQISGSNALQDQFGNEQYSADQDIFGRQRSEQLGMYNSDLDFRRQAEMARLGLLSQEELIDFQRKYNNQDLLGGILGEAGGLAGDLTYDYFHRRGGKKTG